MPVVLTVLGFWLPVLGFLIARRRFGPWRRQAYAGDGPMRLDWDHGTDRWDRKMFCLQEEMDRKVFRLQKKMDRVRARMDGVRSQGDWTSPATSGNTAFDDYRSETLKRLEDEQREFKDFLGRLRFAKDRAEFDQFMAEQRQRPFGADSQQAPSSIEPHN